MSESESAKEGPALSGTVQEVQGWFPGNAALQAAIAALALARYDRSDCAAAPAFRPGRAATADARSCGESQLCRCSCRPVFGGCSQPLDC